MCMPRLLESQNIKTTICVAGGRSSNGTINATTHGAHTNLAGAVAHTPATLAGVR